MVEYESKLETACHKFMAKHIPKQAQAWQYQQIAFNGNDWHVFL